MDKKELYGTGWSLSDLPAKKLDLERDVGDYITVRVNGGANGLFLIRRGTRLRVHGFLQFRDYRESLEEFISKAQKPKRCADLAVDFKACDPKQNHKRAAAESNV